MTLTIDLPDELASRLAATLPTEEQTAFAIAAIANALALREQEDDAPVAAALRAELDPDAEPERDSAECLAIVEAELEDIDSTDKLLSLEEARRQWDAQKAARRMASRP